MLSLFTTERYSFQQMGEIEALHEDDRLDEYHKIEGVGQSLHEETYINYGVGRRAEVHVNPWAHY